MDFRAIVDPRAGMQVAPAPLTLRLGAPSEWLDRANTLADVDRMEAALGALRSTATGWGPLADDVLNDFVHGLRVRRRDGRVSAGSWCALLRSLVRSTQRLSGRVRPGVGAPVALIASPGGCAGPVLLSMAEAVLREAGFTVLDVGCLHEAGALEEIIAEQQPHLVALLADAEAGAADLVTRLHGVGRAAARRGTEVWLAGGATWPMIDGARLVPSFAALGEMAATAIAREGNVRRAT